MRTLRLADRSETHPRISSSGLLPHQYTSGTHRRLNLLSTFLLYAYRARHFAHETPWWYAALHPFGIGVFIHAMLRSASTTLAGGGIEWRGTLCPLKELKNNVIRGSTGLIRHQSGKRVPPDEAWLRSP